MDGNRQDRFLVFLLLGLGDDLFRRDIPPNDSSVLTTADDVLFGRVMDREARSQTKLTVHVTGVFLHTMTREHWRK